MQEQLPPEVSFPAPPTPPDPPAPPAPPAAGHRVGPAGLWNAVLSARADLICERHLPQRHLERSAQVALLEALESYVTSLTDRGHPVPYPLRDELRLQRLTCMTSRGDRPMTRREQPTRGH